MNNDSLKLQVYQTGEVTVLGFGGEEILHQLDLAECRDQIVKLVKDSNCKVLAFDLTGVRLVPSGLLGLLTSLRELGVEVQIFNPSDDVREVLEITKLDQLIKVKNIDLNAEDQA